MGEGSKEILAKMETLETRVTRIEADVDTLKSDVKTLKTDTKTLKSDVKTLKTDVKTIKGDVITLKGDATTLKTDVNELKELKAIVLGMKEEHGALLRAILENKEVQRGEIDVLQHRTARIEGAVKGAAKQTLADLKDVSNR